MSDYISSMSLEERSQYVLDLCDCEPGKFVDGDLAHLRLMLWHLHKLWEDFDDENQCKSGEGRVSLVYPSYFVAQGAYDPPRVEVYSYLFGSGRNHYFEDLEDAIHEVREWARSYVDALSGTPAVNELVRK